MNYKYTTQDAINYLKNEAVDAQNFSLAAHIRYCEKKIDVNSISIDDFLNIIQGENWIVLESDKKYLKDLMRNVKINFIIKN